MGPSRRGRRPLPRRYPDREPRRPLGRGRTRPSRRWRSSRPRTRAGPADCCAAWTSASRSSRCSRATRTTARPSSSSASTPGRTSRWSRTAACRASPIPGYRVVRRAVDRGIDVRVVPGPSAAIAALVLSGPPDGSVRVRGFPAAARGRSHRAGSGRSGDDPRTVVLFESPRRVHRLLEEIVAELGDRRVAVCRELTKLHEEVIRGSAGEVLARLGDRELKGEVAVVVEGEHDARPPDPEALLAEVRRLIDGRDARPRRRSRRGGTPRRERQRPLPGHDLGGLIRAGAVFRDGCLPYTALHGADASSPRPPPLVPPRPDQEALRAGRSSPPSSLATVVAVVLGVLASCRCCARRRVLGDLDAAAPEAPSTVADPPPRRPRHPRRPRRASARRFGRRSMARFRFLERVGGSPVRWNPCDPITYAVNTAGASSARPARPAPRRSLA